MYLRAEQGGEESACEVCAGWNEEKAEEESVPGGEDSILLCSWCSFGAPFPVILLSLPTP